MDLSIYNVIVGPVITDKAYKLNRDLKKLVLWVHPAANKPLVKEAFKKLFNVEVDNVRILVRDGKVRRVGRRIVKGITKKKAIVTLAEGYSLDLFDQGGAEMVASDVEKTAK
ncbi:MAG TPA: 50S ribosomal protein L23 [Candidatus Babeliales bacterium]|nr:50S ribosomal protein L23 [Candidatus Babeliales bacterium]